MQQLVPEVVGLSYRTQDCIDCLDGRSTKIQQMLELMLAKMEFFAVKMRTN
jgi:hypothetical protein